MAKVFSINYSQGKLTDKFGSVGTNTNAIFQQTEKGLAPYFNGNGVITYTGISKPATSYSLAFATKITSLVSERQPLGYNTGSGFQVYMADGSGVLTWTNTSGAVSSGVSDKVGEWVHYVLVSDASGNYKYIYRNGILIASGANHINLTNADLYIGRRNQNANFWKGFIGGEVALFDTALTSQEVAKLYSEFVSLQPISKPKRGFLVNKPNDFSKERYKTVGSELMTTISNASGYEYSTFTSSGANITSAITSTIGRALSNDLGSCSIGDKYLISINLTLNSGSYPEFSMRENNAGGINLASSYNRVLVSGDNTFQITTQVASTDPRLVLISSSASNYSATISVKKLSGLVAAYNMQKVGNTLVDISGNGNNASIVGNKNGVIQTKDGLKLDGTAGVSRTALSAITQAGTYTINCRVKFNSLLGIGIVWANGLGSSDRNGLVVNVVGALSFEKYNGTAYSGKRASGILANTWYNISCVNTGGTHTLYVNGVEETSTSTINELGNSAQELNIGIDLPNGTGTRNANMDIADFKVYNRALSLQEVKDYHNSFAKQPYLVEDFSDAPADGTSIVPRDWQKISGSWKVGEITLTAGERLTNGDFSNGLTGWTTSIGAGNNATVVNGQLLWECIVAGTGLDVYQPTKLTVGKRYRFTYDIISSTSSTGISIVASGGTILNCAVGTGRTQEFTASHTTFFLTRNNAATIVLDNLSIVEIDPLPTLTKGSKYLECVTAGYLSIPSKQAYGTWEFDWYKGADASQLVIWLMSDKIITKTPNGDSVNGYHLWLYTDEKIYLQRDSGGTYVTLNSSSWTFNNNTWHRIKVTRTTSGLFNVLIKGGGLTPTAGYDGWYLAFTAVTDATVTSSNYLGVYMGAAGDRIANIKLTNGVIV